jgi:hypothetical protein
MSVNGILLYARSYNSTSTAAQPAVIAIQVGKGFKGLSSSIYKASGKATAGSLDIGYDATNSYGAYTTYNENTGVLLIDAGYRFSNVANFYFSDGSVQANGYVVINASKSPTLAAVPQLQSRFATLSDVKSASVQGGSSIVGTQTRTLNTLVDNTGIVSSLSSNQFTLTAGEYYIEATTPAFAVNTHRSRIRNITDSTTSLLGSSEYSGSGAASFSNVKGSIVITSTKVFELQHYTSAAAATNGLGVNAASGENEVYSVVKIHKIK